jgi:nucleotide-binding universal stress UspA family protein
MDSLNRYGTYRQILFCTDFSPNADLAFGLAVEAAERNRGSMLTLLHVLPEPDAQFWKNYLYGMEDVDTKARADIDRKVEETYRPRIPPELQFRTVFKIGNPAHEILDFAKTEKVDLIVLGRQGQGSVFYGNVVSRIARTADCPVLVVPMAFAGRLPKDTD